MAPAITSISPLSGPPGAALTVTGSGFVAGARIGCPVLVDTRFVSENELACEVPDLSGTGTLGISVYAQNPDGSVSNVATFTVVFETRAPQGWTDIERVCGEIPNFRRGGEILDATINGWIRSVAQAINAALLGRGISLHPADWQQPAAGSAMPSPVDVLEQINRYGAAARLAGAVGGQFSAAGEWSVAKNLRADFEGEMKLLRSGAYDKMFRPLAPTQQGPEVEVGEVLTDSGDPDRLFTKDKIF